MGGQGPMISREFKGYDQQKGGGEGGVVGWVGVKELAFRCTRSHRQPCFTCDRHEIGEACFKADALIPEEYCC